MYYLIFLTSIIYSVNSFAVSQDYIKRSIKRAAEKVGVPHELLSAICWAESKQEHEAYVHEDGKAENHAFGMCQVLYKTALGLGMSKETDCLRDFRTKKALQNAGEKVPSNFQALPRNYKSCKLFGPYTNAYYAAKFLRLKLDRYNESWISAIAAYNSGIVRTCSKKGYFTLRTYKEGIVEYKKITCIPGGLLNQEYVDRVLRALKGEK